MVIYSLALQDFSLPAFVHSWASRHGYELRHVNVNTGMVSRPELWEVDMLLVLDWRKISASADAEVVRWVSLLEKCGRPIFYGTMQDLSEEKLSELSLKPRTNYRPIDCGYYDHFEAAIIKRKPQAMKLSCFSTKAGSNILSLHLLDTKTWRKEEFVEVEEHGWLRADWVDLVDVSLSDNCSI